MQLKRIGLAAAAAFVSVNIWTGAPLLALWVGSRTVPSSGLSMSAVFIVVGVLLALVLGLVWILSRLNERYDRLTGRDRLRQRRTSPWLRSMRSEREEYEQQRRRSSAIEQVVVVSVVLAALVFNYWFFFLAGSPI
jgi:hypothetical protein